MSTPSATSMKKDWHLNIANACHLNFALTYRVNANQKWHRFRKVDMTPLLEGTEGRGHRSEAGRGGEAAVSPDVNAECIVLRSAEAKVPTPVGQAALGSGS